MSQPAAEAGPARDEYWAAIDEGRLQFQACQECENRWLPPRDHCPRCLSDRFEWQTASGEAEVMSWVIYHMEYGPQFHDRLPYNVALVRLAEGPQLITNLVKASSEDPEEPDLDSLTAGERVQLRIARWPEGPLLPLFAVSDRA